MFSLVNKDGEIGITVIYANPKCYNKKKRLTKTLKIPELTQCVVFWESFEIDHLAILGCPSSIIFYL